MYLFKLFDKYKFSYLILFISSFLCILFEGFGYATIWPIVNSILEVDSNDSNRILLIYKEFFNYINLDFNVINLSLLLLVLIILKNLLKIYNYYLTDQTVHTTRMHWMNLIINNYNNLPFIDFINKRRGIIYNNITLETKNSSNAVKNFTEIFTALMSIIIFLTIFIINSITLTLIVIFAGILVFIINKTLLGNYSKATGRQEVELNQNISNIISDYIAAYKNIKVFRAYKQIQENIYYKLSKLRNILVKWAVYTFLPVPVIEIFITAIIVSFIIYSSINSSSQSILSSFPDLALTAVLSHRLLQQLTRFIVSYNSFNRVRPSLQTIYNEIFINTKVDENNSASKNIKLKKVEGNIELNNIDFNYSDRKLFNSLNIKIPTKKITTFIGESGTGKSTIAEIILGLIKPTKGNITINGININDINNYYDKVLYVSQDNILIDDSIEENIKFFKDNIDEDLFKKVVKEFKIDQIYNQFENQLSRNIKNSGENLSGGQKQRICVARAMVRNPEILILDEATSALDNKNEEIILKAIIELMKDKTIILISHKKSIVDYADIVFEIKNNNIFKIK